MQDSNKTSKELTLGCAPTFPFLKTGIQWKNDIKMGNGLLSIVVSQQADCVPRTRWNIKGYECNHNHSNDAPMLNATPLSSCPQYQTFCCFSTMDFGAYVWYAWSNKVPPRIGTPNTAKNYFQVLPWAKPTLHETENQCHLR